MNYLLFLAALSLSYSTVYSMEQESHRWITFSHKKGGEGLKQFKTSPGGGLFGNPNTSSETEPTEKGALTQTSSKQEILKNDPEAQYNLGLNYARQGNINKATECWAQEILQDHPQAQYNLGLNYARQGNINKATECWAQEILKNDPEAQYNLGLNYARQGNINKAIECWAQEILKNDPKAQYNLGFAYFKKGNTDKAIECWAQEILKNDPKAQYNLGFAYFKKGNTDKAIEWFEKAIRNKNVSIRDKESWEVQKYKVKEFFQNLYFNQKLDFLHFFEILKSYKELSEVTLDVLQNIQKEKTADPRSQEIFQFCKRGALQGDRILQNLLGDCYLHGIGCAVSFQKAKEWYSNAFKNNNKASGYNLGLWFESYASSDEASKASALSYYRKASKAGVEMADYALGRLYEEEANGGGVQDLPKATRHYEKAAKAGIPGAISALVRSCRKQAKLLVEQAQAGILEENPEVESLGENDSLSAQEYKDKASFWEQKLEKYRPSNANQLPRKELKRLGFKK